MALFTMSGVLRGFPSAEYDLYASTKTLVRPCSSGAKHCSATKCLIYELETYLVPNTCYVIYGWALTIEWKMKRNPDWSGQMDVLLCRHGYHSLVPLGKEPTVDMRWSCDRGQSLNAYATN
jgi:hypothetical protein